MLIEPQFNNSYEKLSEGLICLFYSGLVWFTSYDVFEHTKYLNVCASELKYINEWKEDVVFLFEQ